MANDIDILLEAIADVESKGTGGYAAKNPKSSASGKYQFMWSQWGDKIRDFAKNPNLTEEEFRANPELQENYARHYVNTVLTPEAKKLQSKYGSRLKKRNVMDLEDAQTLIHFQGYPNSSQYVKTGKTANLQNNKSVPEYISKAREGRIKRREVAQKGVSMAAKSGENIEEMSLPLETEEKPKETTTQAEAAARGIARGVSFDFADEITAALESAVSGKSYDQALAESRAAYEKTAKEWPGTTLGAGAVGGAASMLIPGVGALGRTAQIAGAATKAAKAKELIRGGAQLGALGGLGQAEDLSKPLETAETVATGAVTGGALGYAVPKGLEKLAESRAGKAVAEGAKKVVGALQERIKGQRWQIPEFAAQPEKQARVDEIVKQGKSAGLTDRQILNQIAVEFKELPTESLERAFTETGIKGKLKRAVAGSQEAVEFIERPEQMARAERIRKGETEEMARLKSDIRVGKEAEKTTERELARLQRATGEDVEMLRNEMADLVEQYKMTQSDSAKRDIEQKIQFAKEKLKLSTGIDKRKEDIQRLKEINAQNKLSVQSELEKLNKTRSEEQLKNVAQLRDELNEQVTELAKQRNSLVDNLMSEDASDAHIESIMSLKRELQNTLDEQGMGEVGRGALNTAFSGDARFQKLNKWMTNKEQQRAYDESLANQKWNASKGIADNAKDARFVDRVLLEMGRPKDLAPEDMPSLGDIVGTLYAANQKISSAQYGTPLASVKRGLAETIQERMGEISEEAYAIQRQLAATKAQVSTIEKSPFFATKAVPVVGKTGRVATAPKKFIKTELPDLSKQPKDYKEELKKIGVNIDEIENIINENQINRFKVSSEETIPGIQQQIAQQQKELGRAESAYRQQSLQQQLEQQDLAKQQVAQQSEIRKQIMERRGQARAAMEPLRAQKGVYEDYLTQLRTRRQQLGETEQQLRGTLEETEGVPASMRDVGQAAVIGAKGEVPFAIGKIFVPSPKTRIQFVNKISNRFKNPSLTSAARVAIERPITMEVVRSLATTHKVSEPELMRQFEESGIPIEMEESGVQLKAQPLEQPVKATWLKHKVERDKFGNYIVVYDDPEVDYEIFTPEQWAEVRSQFE